MTESESEFTIYEIWKAIDQTILGVIKIHKTPSDITFTLKGLYYFVKEYVKVINPEQASILENRFFLERISQSDYLKYMVELNKIANKNYIRVINSISRHDTGWIIFQ